MSSSELQEILQREGLQPPKTLTFAITGACNLKCLHCWVESGVSSSASHVPKQTLCRLIEEFAAIGGEGVRFTGGEPLCHPDWLELVRYAREIGLVRVSLQTNAMLFTDNDVAVLRGLDFPGLSIQISMDGATAPVHNLVRGEGAFRVLLDGIRCLLRAGLAPRISLMFTEMRHNLEDIPAVLEFADNLSIPSVVTGTLISGGRAAEGSLAAPPDTNQYLRLMQCYDSDPKFRELYGKIGKVAALEWRKSDFPRSECCTFVENPYLTPKGELYPCVLCHSDNFAVTGIFDKSLSEAFAEGARLWSALLGISRKRAFVLEECRDCPGKTACAGGCMGRAQGSCGDLLAADDRCGTRRAIYQRSKLRDSELTNIPFYISSSGHLCRSFNRKILSVALLRLRFCSIRNGKSDLNLSIKLGISVNSKSLKTAVSEENSPCMPIISDSFLPPMVAPDEQRGEIPQCG